VEWPPVSVVVITKDEEKNIRDCLDSLLSLDYPRYEILVVDCSTDRTPELVKKFKKVKLITIKEPGFAFARNSGIRRSKFGVIAFTDADCVVPKEWLKKLVPHLKGETVGAGGAAIPPRGSDYLGMCIACLGFPAGGSLGTEIMRDISTCNAVYRKDAIRRVGGFDEKLEYGTEDSDLCGRITSGGKQIKLVPDSFVFHKTRGGRDFLGWSYRRGKARFHKNKNPLTLLSPLGIFAYPFTKKFRLIVRKRKEIGIDFKAVLVIVPFLFLLRQIMLSLGWLGGVKEGVEGKKKREAVQKSARSER
jgi:GT2 family glycosyltransferase